MPILMVCLIEWAGAYLDHSKAHHIHNTYQEKVKAFRYLFRLSVSPSLPVGALTRLDVIKHFQALSEAGRSGRAINNDRKNLVAAWNWGVKNLPGFPATNPFLVDRFAEERRPRYVPPIADFWAVLAHVEGLQDRLFLLCLLFFAARRAELFHLKVDDVDLGRRQVRLATRKRRDGSLEYDLVPIADPVLPALTEHLGRLSGGVWVFPNPRTGKPYVDRKRWMERLCASAGVRPFGFHALRHLAASIMADHAVPMVQIQQVLRHKRMTTTERYIRSLSGCRGAVAVIPAPPPPPGPPSRNAED